MTLPNTRTRNHDPRNNFAHLSEYDAKEKRSKYLIRAFCCECGTFESVELKNPSTAQEFAEKYFRRDKGWKLGSSRSKDVCPTCVAKQKDEKMKTPIAKPIVRQERATTAAVVQMNGALKVIAPDADPGATLPPREMSRDDRRIIFSKLEDVYLDEATGYSAGWSDAKLATDLNVPRAWVEKIREENFGPAIDEETVAIMARLNDLRAAASDAIGEITSKLDEMKGRLSAINETIRNLSSRNMK